MYDRGIYEDARAAFRAVGHSLLADRPGGSLTQIALPGDDDLTIDLLYLT